MDNHDLVVKLRQTADRIGDHYPSRYEAELIELMREAATALDGDRDAEDITLLSNFVGYVRTFNASMHASVPGWKVLDDHRWNNFVGAVSQRVFVAFQELRDMVK